jgi:hypothetical protein
MQFNGTGHGPLKISRQPWSKIPNANYLGYFETISTTMQEQGYATTHHLQRNFLAGRPATCSNNTLLSACHFLIGWTSQAHFLFPHETRRAIRDEYGIISADWTAGSKITVWAA